MDISLTRFTGHLFIVFDSYCQNELTWQDLIMPLCVNRRLPCSFFCVMVYFSIL